MQLQNQTTPAVKAYFDQDDIPGVVDVVDDQNKATIYQRDWAGNLSDQKSFIVGGENAAIRGTFDNFVVGDIVLKNSFKLSPEALSQKLSEHGISTE
jgi:20S proteasome alpha/beta subunit